MCTTQIMSSLDQATNMLKNYMKSRSIIYHSELCTKIKFSSCFLPDFANVCTVLVWRPVLLTLNFLVIPTFDLRRSFLFPNSFSYGVLANIGSGAVPGRLRGAGSGRFREGSGAGSERQVPGGSGAGSERQVPGGSGKLPGQAPNDRFREGSGADGFREGSGAGSERQVPGRFRTTFRTTGSGKVPGQVLIQEFREVSGAGSEPRVSGQVPGVQGSAWTVPERFWPGF